MSFTTAIESRWADRCKRVGGAALTLTVLTAVAVVGLTLLGSEVLASWKGPGNAEQTLAARSAFEGLLTFDAPASTAARQEVQAKETQNSKDSTSNASNAPLLVKNWKYTQLTTSEAFQLSWKLYAYGTAILLLDQFLDARLPGNQQLVSQLLTPLYQTVVAWENIINLFVPTALRPPTLPPASPYL